MKFSVCHGEASTCIYVMERRAEFTTTGAAAASTPSKSFQDAEPSQSAPLWSRGPISPAPVQEHISHHGLRSLAHLELGSYHLCFACHQRQAANINTTTSPWAFTPPSPSPSRLRYTERHSERSNAESWRQPAVAPRSQLPRQGLPPPSRLLPATSESPRSRASPAMRTASTGHEVVWSVFLPR